MSRYTGTRQNGNSVAYGFDHACGYFYQEFTGDDEDRLIKNVDSMFDKLTGVGLSEELVGLDVPKGHLDRMLMDLPF